MGGELQEERLVLQKYEGKCHCGGDYDNMVHILTSTCRVKSPQISKKNRSIQNERLDWVVIRDAIKRFIEVFSNHLDRYYTAG